MQNRLRTRSSTSEPRKVGMNDSQPVPSTFTTREIQIPTSLQQDAEEESGPISALPDELMAALSRDPGEPTSRQSFSTSRPTVQSVTSSPESSRRRFFNTPSVSPVASRSTKKSSASPAAGPQIPSIHNSPFTVDTSAWKNSSSTPSLGHKPSHSSLRPEVPGKDSASSEGSIEREVKAQSYAFQSHHNLQKATEGNQVGLGFTMDSSRSSIRSGQSSQKNTSGTARFWKQFGFQSRKDARPRIPTDLAASTPLPSTPRRVSVSVEESEPIRRSGSRGLGLDEELSTQEREEEKQRRAELVQQPGISFVPSIDDDREDDWLPREETFGVDLADRSRRRELARPNSRNVMADEQDTDLESDTDSIGEERDEVDEAWPEQRGALKPSALSDQPATSAFARNRGDRQPKKPNNVRIDSMATAPRGPQTAPSDGASFAAMQDVQIDSNDPARNRSQSDSVVQPKSQGYQTAATDMIGITEKRPMPISRTRSSSLVKTVTVNQQARRSQADFVIAVVGPKGVGKSTIISRVVRKTAVPEVLLSEEGGNQVSSYESCILLAGINRSVEILEVDMAILRYGQEGLLWPSFLPSIDGAMLCYDASNKEALSYLRRMLGGFWTKGDISLIVLGCKSARDASMNALDPVKVSDLCNPYRAGLVQLDGGLEDPSKKMKNSFRWLIHSVVKARGEAPPSPKRHRSKQRVSRRGSVEGLSRSSSRPPSPVNSVTSSNNEGESFVRFAAEVDANQVSDGKPLKRQTSGLPTVFSSPFESDDRSSTAKNLPTESAPVPAPKRASVVSPNAGKSGELDLYYSRDEIIEKFLFAAVTDNDEQFVLFFIIAFRRFARPSDVLSKLMERYGFVETRIESDPVLARYAQSKLSHVLAMWMESYPGDFASPSAYYPLQGFLERMLLSSWVSHYAVELLPLLKPIAREPDPDEGWALPEQGMEDLELDSAVRQAITAQNDPSAKSIASSKMTKSNSRKSLFSVTDSFDDRDSAPGTPVESSFKSNANRQRGVSDAGTHDSAGSSSHHKPSSGLPRRAGQSQVYSNLADMSNAVSDLDSKMVALEITRVAWEIFASISPRDLVRFVFAPRDPVDAGGGFSERSLHNPVARSITFVNFLSDWVATLILVQNKPKHRVRLFEKMIEIASHLRDLENFDSLMGVLAGLNAQPVYRLDSEMEPLKLKPIYKKYRSLNRLMSTGKGFAAYRLALANSGTQRLPYLGCHLQDLIRYSEGKSDMRNGLCNWTKFQQMANTAAVVIDCPSVAPNLPVHQHIETLIIDVPVLRLEDDTLYELSYAYKPRTKRTTTERAQAKLRTFMDSLT